MAGGPAARAGPPGPGPGRPPVCEARRDREARGADAAHVRPAVEDGARGAGGTPWAFSAAPSRTLPGAPLAQRQSNGLLIRRFGVQIPGGAPGGPVGSGRPHRHGTACANTEQPDPNPAAPRAAGARTMPAGREQARRGRPERRGKGPGEHRTGAQGWHRTEGRGCPLSGAELDGKRPQGGGAERSREVQRRRGRSIPIG